MVFTSLINHTRDRIARRRRYNRMVEEIQNMSQRDLADINGNRAEMLHNVWSEVYGR